MNPIVWHSILSLVVLGGMLGYMSGCPSGQFYDWTYRYPVLAACVVWVYISASCFRMGPDFVKTVGYRGAFMVNSTLLTLAMAVGALDPIEKMPFGSALYYIGSIAIFWLPWTIWMMLLPPIIPPEPIKSLVGPIIQAHVLTIRMLDRVTDIQFAKVLMREV